MLIAGADGCPGGWVVATARLEGSATPCRGLAVEKVDRLDRFVEMTRLGELAALAIDMPIGVLDVHPRTADVEARRLLGDRRSSVFPTPVLATLDATDYRDACDRSRVSCGKALSRQAWNLMPKIRQLDQLIERDDQAHIVEAHPECAFLRLRDGQPLDDPKSSPEGRRMRADLLAGSGLFVPAELGAILTPRHGSRRDAPLTDLLDALVLTVTARHVCLGSERRLGDQTDLRGRRAEIVF